MLFHIMFKISKKKKKKKKIGLKKKNLKFYS